MPGADNPDLIDEDEQEYEADHGCQHDEAELH